MFICTPPATPESSAYGPLSAASGLYRPDDGYHHLMNLVTDEGRLARARSGAPARALWSVAAASRRTRSGGRLRQAALSTLRRPAAAGPATLTTTGLHSVTVVDAGYYGDRVGAIIGVLGTKGEANPVIRKLTLPTWLDQSG